MTKPTIKIVRGDCTELLRQQPTDSVDLVFYDPPYNIKKKYDGYADNKSEEEYVEWMIDLFRESERVSRRGVIAYIGGKLLKTFINIFPINSHVIIVHKKAAGVFSGNYMLQYHAMLSSAKPVIKVKDLWDDIRLPGEGYFFREPRYEHPGLTSLKLTERVIQNFTVEGETVLDPFSGVGTTAVACKKLGRGFVGFEQSQLYIDTAVKRLSEVEYELPTT